MIEIEIPKDITKYEAKIAGVATIRQVVCVGIAGILGTAIKFGINDRYNIGELGTVLILIAAIIPCSFLIKPYGMKMEEFLLSVMTTYVLAPTKRKYRVKNRFEQEFNKMLNREKKIIALYDKNHNIKHNVVRNDPKDKPAKKVFKGKPEFTGYI